MEYWSDGVMKQENDGTMQKGKTGRPLCKMFATVLQILQYSNTPTLQRSNELILQYYDALMVQYFR